MHNKRLLIIIPSLGGGGAERQMCHLLDMLGEKNISPVVLTFDRTLCDYPSSTKYKRINIAYKSKLLRNIALGLRVVFFNPRIILSYLNDANIIASIYKQINPKCRVVVSERNTIQFPLSKRAQLLYRLYEKVDHIVPNSHTQARLLSSLYPSLKEKIMVITNYTDVGKYCSVVFNPPKDVVRIIIPARYNHQKNTLTFIEAVNILKNDSECPAFECEWFGRGVDTPYYAECAKKISDYQLDNIVLNDFSPNIYDIMSKADIVCLPSKYEGFANALAEGICMGKPILTSNVCDNPVFCKEGVNGTLFSPDSAEDIAVAMKRILMQKDHYQVFSENSRMIAKELFDKERFINAYMTLLYE